MKRDRHLLAVKVIIESCQVFTRRPKTDSTDFKLTAIEFAVDFAMLASAFSSAIVLLEVFDLHPEVKALLITIEEFIKAKADEITYTGVETKQTNEHIAGVFKSIDDAVSSVLKTIGDKIKQEN